MGLLELEEVTRTFGGVVALDGVSMEVSEGEIAGLIGPNGAGKTTAFNVITRLYAPDRGRVSFEGQNLLRVPARGIVERGIARLYKRLMAKYAPGANANNGLYFYGMAKAADFVQALYRAGKNPTRASLMRAVVNLSYRSPWVLPGSNVATSARNAFPIKYQRLTRYNNGSFTEFGRLQKIR